MQLLRHREFIHTECSLYGSPILNVKALKIDANQKSLKRRMGCGNLKSCDYFRRKKDNLYFIELSDFHQQLIDLAKVNSDNEASKIIKNEVRLKLSDTLLLYHKILKQGSFGRMSEK